MKNRLKKIGGWVLLSLMVLALIVGCNVTGSGTGNAGAGAVSAEGTETVGNKEENAGAGKDAANDADSKEEADNAELADSEADDEESEDSSEELDEHGFYNTKDEVALFLHTYGRLPDNYITKKEAENLGWDSKKGNLDDIAPGKSIGGSHFGNYDKQLPEKKGRKYFECDLNYDGGYRGAERIIYSNDGLVFYTGDHYETFEQLY